MTIEHISDTARWVAVYRALETERPDAIFRDPYARALAGEHGERIVDAMPRGRQTAWAMIVRTAVFDEIILRAVRDHHADMVINLAAGLDARPWRLALPPALRWVDVDLPAILQYKTDHLANARPVCQYEAVSADLTDAATRQALFAKLGAEAKTALIVTEGLLVYLTTEQVGALATDLAQQASFRWWLFDLASPMLLAYLNRQWGKTLEAGNAPFRFAPPEGTGFFRPAGWQELEFRSALLEARRLQREMPRAWLWRILGVFASAERKRQMQRMSGMVLLARAPATGG